MRVLMIAPEPFFEPRGTPFSILARLLALSQLGHKVDLVTYHLGEDVTIPNVTVRRSPGLPFLRRVRIGPSWTKFLLDLFLFLKAFRLAARGGYEVVHTHEEACYFGAALRRLTGIPHLYDMHSSVPEHLVNYRFLPRLRRLACIGERWVLRRSDCVIVVYPQLLDHVRKESPHTPVVLVENVQPPPDWQKAQTHALRLRRRLAINREQIILYTGNLERNQGIDMLLESVPHVLASQPDARFLLVGGEPRQVQVVREKAVKLGVEENVIFLGKRPCQEMPGFLMAADILVSPRTVGSNTPLKIYSYLAAGKPIVATRIFAHTQILDDSVALLTEVSPKAFGEGIARLIGDRELQNRLGQAAATLARERYSWTEYVDRVREAYATLDAIPLATSIGCKSAVDRPAGPALGSYPTESVGRSEKLAALRREV